MGELVHSALEEADRVVKKQKVCASQTADAVNKLLQELQRAQLQAQQNPGTCQAVIEELSSSLAKQDLPSQVAKATKELHSSVAKLGKALDQAFIQDISQAYRDVPFDSTILDKVIAEHFFQEGSFEVGECFLAEAGIPGGDAVKEPYRAMHAILREIKAGNLQPALDWAAEHRQQLTASTSDSVAKSFEFKLHRLQFLDVLGKQGQKAALQYARSNFSMFQRSHLAGIQRLMGCLCYAKRPAKNPYKDLMSPTLWKEAARDFARHCCGLMGQASESPLLVATAAGSVALPTLLKLAGLLKDHDLASGEQLPVELELGHEFVFRSVFSCPVSREQSSPANPPMLLPCGHVLCKGSILKIAKTPTRSFKCPYCPLEASLATCRQLYFPPML